MGTTLTERKSFAASKIEKVASLLNLKSELKNPQQNISNFKIEKILGEYFNILITFL